MARGLIKGITKRQADALEFIKKYVREHDVPPTMAEIAAALSITPPSVLDLLASLERKGFIDRRRAMGPRAMRVLSPRGTGRRKRGMMPTTDDGTAWVSIVGRVAAGEPILAEENIVGRVRIDALVARGQCFALEVDGDSMVDIGIPDGGLVIVRQQPVAENGDVVVAMVDGGEATVKRLFINDERIELRPENEKYKPIPVGPDSDLKILGKVIGVRERNG
ncbi:MAG: transcriptional repressor LexA [Nitrospirota bacterium]|nr:transcriptional repressor LexA [Nitrospirota bacterium]